MPQTRIFFFFFFLRKRKKNKNHLKNLSKINNNKRVEANEKGNKTKIIIT